MHTCRACRPIHRHEFAPSALRLKTITNLNSQKRRTLKKESDAPLRAFQCIELLCFSMHRIIVRICAVGCTESPTLTVPKLQSIGQNEVTQKNNSKLRYKLHFLNRCPIVQHCATFRPQNRNHCKIVPIFESFRLMSVRINEDPCIQRGRMRRALSAKEFGCGRTNHIFGAFSHINIFGDDELLAHDWLFFNIGAC